MVAGVGGAIDAYESRTYIEEQSSGTFTVNENESWEIQVYIIHPVDCESVDLTIVDSRGDDVIGFDSSCYYEDYGGEEMYEPGDRQLYADINHEMSGMEYTLSSNVDVEISGSYCDDACIDSAISGGLSALGGFMGICCSIPIIIVGVIFAFTLDDSKTSSTMQVGQMTTGNVAYQTPVSGQAMYQTPVSGQVAHQTPVSAQAPMTQTTMDVEVGPIWSHDDYLSRKGEWADAIPGWELTGHWNTTVPGRMSVVGYRKVPENNSSPVSQPASAPITQITPPLTQQPSVEQTTPPTSVPITPITPPTTQQPEQTAWWGDEPQQ